jgi:hypothetical protein
MGIMEKAEQENTPKVSQLIRFVKMCVYLVITVVSAFFLLNAFLLFRAIQIEDFCKSQVRQQFGDRVSEQVKLNEQEKKDHPDWTWTTLGTQAELNCERTQKIFYFF